METSESEKKLEKFLKKLEKLDIREWTYRLDISRVPHPLTAETCGLRFILDKYGILEIENITGGPYSEYYSISSIKNKSLKKTLKQLYDVIYDKLKEHKRKELEEKIEAFLSE